MICSFTMNTIIVHPKDRTTDFLKPIYQNIPSKRVVTGDMFAEDVVELCEQNERIMMMGHGSPRGLFAIGQFYFPNRPYVIDRWAVKTLREKQNAFYIWCNADQFVNEHDLKGFFTGMFVSEVGEAQLFDLPPNQAMVDASNNLFAELLGEVVNEPIQDAYNYVKEHYGKLAETNPIAKYNHDRLYFKN